MTIARRITRRIEAVQRAIANAQARWADYWTPPLTDAEWADVYTRFPRLARHFNRGILTAGETARCYRVEIAFETLDARKAA